MGGMNQTDSNEEYNDPKNQCFYAWPENSIEAYRNGVIALALWKRWRAGRFSMLILELRSGIPKRRFFIYDTNT